MGGPPKKGKAKGKASGKKSGGGGGGGSGAGGGGAGGEDHDFVAPPLPPLPSPAPVASDLPPERRVAAAKPLWRDLDRRTRLCLLTLPVRELEGHAAHADAVAAREGTFSAPRR